VPARVADSPGSAARPDSIARNVGGYLAVQLTSYAFTAALTLFLVRRLSPHGYGLLSFATAIGGLLSFPADFGISQSAARFIAENRADRAVVGRIIGCAVQTKLVIGGLVSLALFAASNVIASAYGEPALTWILRVVSIAILAQGLTSLLSYALIALGRTAQNMRVVLSQSIVEIAATVSLVLLGAGAVGAAFGRALSYVCAAAVATWVVVCVLGRGTVRIRAESGPWRGRIVRYGGVLVIVDSAYALFGQIDVLLVGAFLTPTAVGLFSAPLRLIPLLQLPAVAVSAGVSPRMAGAQRERAPDAFVAGLRYVSVLQAALVAPLLIWAGPIVELLFGPAYGDSADVLRALTPFAFLLGFGTLLSMTANYLGQARPRIVVAVVTTMINVVVDVVLIPRIGIVGGAVGTDLAYAFYAPAHLWICRRAVDFPIRPVIGALVRALGASAVMALVLLAFGTSPSNVALVAGLLAGSAAFTGVLIASRAITVSEITTVAGNAWALMPGRERG